VTEGAGRAKEPRATSVPRGDHERLARRGRTEGGDREEAAPPGQAEKGRRQRLGKRRDKRKEAAASLRSRSGTEGWGTGATPKTSM